MAVALVESNGLVATAEAVADAEIDGLDAELDMGMQEGHKVYVVDPVAVSGDMGGLRGAGGTASAFAVVGQSGAQPLAIVACVALLRVGGRHAQGLAITAWAFATVGLSGCNRWRLWLGRQCRLGGFVAQAEVDRVHRCKEAPACELPYR